MRILIVTGTFPPRKFGGVTASSYKLATSLHQRGHDVTVYTTDTGNDEKRRLTVPFHDITDGFDVYYFRNVSNWLAFKYRFHLPLGIVPFLKNINKKNFEIIPIQDFRSFMSVIIYFAHLRGDIPYLIQARGSMPYEEGNYYFKRLFDILIGKRILRSAAKVIALSKIEADQYAAFGVEEGRIEVIPNGVKISDYLFERDRGLFLDKIGLSKNDKVILSLGRLNKIKGLDLLIEAFAKVLEDVNDAVLVIAGPDDGDLPRLTELVRDLRINERVRFVGPLYGNDKLEAYSEACVFVLPSIYEAFGNTVIESLACGTPVIATNGCHIADVVKQAGIVVDQDAEQLKDAILSLIGNEELAERLGKVGRELVFGQFDQDRVTDRAVQVYQECLRHGDY
jgi:glycosyltransferase involved in cell wall biosynthesis